MKLTLKTIFIIMTFLFMTGMGTARAFDPASFDVDQFILKLQQKHSITFEMAEIRRHWDSLSEEAKAKLSPYYIPAPLSNSQKSYSWLWKLAEIDTPIEGAKTLITGHFRIIWGENYKDYVDKYSAYYTYWGDSDGDGYPNWIEMLAGSDLNNGNDPYDPNDPLYDSDFSDGICETVWAKEIEEMGFPQPDGSDTHYIDLYISNTGVINTAVENNKPGKGITLPGQVYGMASTYQDDIPYIILNQDISVNTLKVTVAHEFFHTVQLSFMSLDDLLEDKNRWLAESTAVWMEDAVYPTVNDYEQYVNYWVDSPERSLFSSDGYHQYGAVIFQKYLTENYHMPDDPDGSDVIKTIWEHASLTADPIEAISIFLAEQSVNPIQSLDDAFANFAIKNLNMKQNYVDGDIYDPIYFTRDVETDVFAETLYEDQVDDYGVIPEYYGTNYIRLRLENNDLETLANRLTLSFEGDGSWTYGLQPKWRVFIVPEGEQGTLYPPVEVSLEESDQGDFIKEDHELYKAANIVVVALPKEDQVFDDWKKFIYHFSFNGYVATRLTKGWNLVNIPADGKDDFETIQTYLKSAWRWDNDLHNWEVSFPNEGDEFTNLYVLKKGFAKLTNFGNSDGIWLLSGENGIEVAFPETAQEESIPIKKGWNLIGINKILSYDVSSLKDKEWCKVAWKWDNIHNTWQVYSSDLDNEALKEYASKKGFSSLEKIYYGEGFWILSLEQAELVLE